MNNRLMLFLAIILNFCAVSNAQVLKDSVLINFRQSKVNLDTAYMGNTEALEHARRTISYYHQPDSNFVLTNVTVVGGASPEGSVRFNQWLSEQRAARIFEYMGRSFDLNDSITSFTFLGRDWEGLRRMVLDDPDVPYRYDVLIALDDIIESVKDGEKENQENVNKLKRLHGGESYLYMYHKLFPTLRASKLVLTFANPRPFMPTLPQIAASMPTETFAVLTPPDILPVYLPLRRLQSPFYMDLRTNMLYDVAAVPNIGAEFYLGKDLSIVGNWMYGWWKNDNTSHYWRIYGGDLGLRYWFGPEAKLKPLTGHHVGVYGSMLTYDFELGGRGYMGGLPGGSLWDEWNWVAALEYGYSLPITRRLNLDFTIGFGTLQGKYRVYDPVDDCYVWKETRNRRWYGPTKAEISLVWLLGRGNYNKGKGGEL